MTSIGINARGIVFVTVIFTAVIALTSVPLGMIADSWSRKGIITVGAGCLGVASLVCGISTTFISYCIGMCLWALYYSCISGAYDATIYDSVFEETGSSTKYKYYYGRLQLYNSVAFIAGSLLSSIVTHFASLQVDYFVSAILAVSSIFFVVQYREPQLHRTMSSQQSHPWKGILDRSFYKSNVINGILGLIILGLLLSLLSEFSPVWYVRYSLPVVLFGPIVAIMQSSIGLSGVIAGRLRSRSMMLWLQLSTILLGCIGLAIGNIVVIIIAVFSATFGCVLGTIDLNNYLHDQLDSKVRASVSSLVSTVSSSTFLPIGLLMGLIIGKDSIVRAAWILVALAAIAAAALLRVNHLKESRTNQLERIV